MAKLNTTFVTSDAPESTSFDALPAGDYVCIISDSEMKDTKAGNGQYLQCTLQVIDGKQQGRQLWTRFNLVNPNSTAVEIATRQLGELCRALGLASVDDSSELHDKPFVAKVKLRPASGQYDASNDVALYKKYDGAATAPVAAAPASDIPSPPWGNAAAPF
jgi:hypothetical protein